MDVPTGEKGNYLFNPTVVGGTMYVLAKNNSIVALDAVTGKERWTHPNTGAVTQRGINYWESKDRSGRRLLYLNAGFLTAIDARTGKLVWIFHSVPHPGEAGYETWPTWRAKPIRQSASRVENRPLQQWAHTWFSRCRLSESAGAA